MNRQNNLKIIITTVIVLVISAIAVFTVVNWAEIVKKFQGAAAKTDGIEKHERNTVPPAQSNTVAATNTNEEWKDTIQAKDDSRKTPNSITDPNDSKLLEDKPKSKTKDSDIYGLEEPPTLKPKKISNDLSAKDKDQYSLGNESDTENKNIFSPEKKVHLKKGKSHKLKKYKRKTITRKQSVKVKNLDKRVTFLEKKLGLKKPKTTGKVSLEKRIYRLEKLVTKQKK
ncbi:MAG: hypothetical protein IPL26_04715 [Leptospiraceae bacterium]|nr:hypothetical protein [Leptospiraceae bacterium]